MVDVGDEKKVKTKKAVHKLAREKEIAELHELLQSYGGRAFIWRILSECKMHTGGFAPSNDHLRHDEGKRNIGVWLEEEVFTADPNAYNIMKNEAVSRDTTNNKEEEK
jgi:hypothetical protein